MFGEGDKLALGVTLFEGTKGRSEGLVDGEALGDSLVTTGEGEGAMLGDWVVLSSPPHPTRANANNTTKHRAMTICFFNGYSSLRIHSAAH